MPVILLVLYQFSVVLSLVFHTIHYFSLRKFPEDFHLFFLALLGSFVPVFNLYLLYNVLEALTKYWKHRKEIKTKIAAQRREEVYKQLDKYKLKDIESYLRMKKLKKLK